MACHYRVAVADAKVGQPEVHARHHSRRGRHAAAAALVRAGARARDVHRRQADRRHARALAEGIGIVDAVIDGDLLDGAIAFAKRARPRRRAPRKTRDLQDKIATRRGRPRRLRGDARGARQDRARRARAVRRGRRDRGRLTMDFDSGSRASASCSPTASCRPSRRRCGTCSSPSARPPRFRTCPRTRPPADIARAASSAPARWAAASRWPTRTPASRCCSRTSTRPRSSAAWRPSARTTNRRWRRAR